jgi:hypothetical protein
MYALNGNPMVYQGTVQNGVVVFPNGIQLPDGTPVQVELVSPIGQSKAKESNNEPLDPIWRMGELAIDTGIPDLSVNIDHYLYGHPKVKDVQSRVSGHEGYCSRVSSCH